MMAHKRLSSTFDKWHFLFFFHFDFLCLFSSHLIAILYVSIIIIKPLCSTIVLSELLKSTNICKGITFANASWWIKLQFAVCHTLLFSEKKGALGCVHLPATKMTLSRVMLEWFHCSWKVWQYIGVSMKMMSLKNDTHWLCQQRGHLITHHLPLHQPVSLSFCWGDTEISIRRTVLSLAYRFARTAHQWPFIIAFLSC